MSHGTTYISPQYNPHSLERDWGFLVWPGYLDGFELDTHGLAALRVRMFDKIIQSIMSDTRSCVISHSHPAIVNADGLSQNTAQLCRDVGLDILTLALLADVPIHRPLTLNHNSLVGHWRWLREVWRHGRDRPAIVCDEAARQSSELIDALTSGKNNLAIAHLRDSFKKVQSTPEDSGAYLSFLYGLTLFCPFIATELLWRQGRINHAPLRRSGRQENEGTNQ
ncbi:hypothetical protein [Thalassospira sp.]|uniref:hypothetical protein n=1 Tax=Thalassospira sp. TaxID=1912094 RepID=UPI003AA9DB08